ncbi:MAG TPA: ABC transporter permease [Bdellovibrionota bacterium]|jgi:spermidine/putrescine transport system permease protein|nr:ABC transporter permease [Bdellovibrionota bacterium]
MIVFHFIAFLTLVFLWSPMILIVNKGFSWTAVEALLRRDDIWHAFSNSLVLGLGASVTATVMGTFTAFSMSFSSSKTRVRMLRGLSFPMLLPEISLGLAQMAWFMSVGLSLGWTTLFFGHFVFLFSYATWIMKLRVDSLDWSLVDAARDLGASDMETFKSALLPQLMPAFGASVFTCFALSLDDFLISFFVKGMNQTTLPIQVYGMLKLRIQPEIYALSLFLFCISLAGILIAKVCYPSAKSKLDF